MYSVPELIRALALKNLSSYILKEAQGISIVLPMCTLPSMKSICVVNGKVNKKILKRTMTLGLIRKALRRTFI